MMGDLKEKTMEEVRMEDELILDRVAKLGEMKEKDGVPQLFVRSNDDSVIELAEIWSVFRDLLESQKIKNEKHVLNTLLRYTAWIIFDGRYSNSKKVNPATKSQLTQSLKSIADTDVHASNSSFGRICSSLIPLTEEPWTGKVFRDAICLETSAEAVDELWQSEGWILLETRMETISRIKKPTLDKIGRILYACASKGNRWSEDDSTSTENEDPEMCDAFLYTKRDYCDLLENCFLIWSKNEDLVDIKFLSSLPTSILIKALSRLRERSYSGTRSRLLPRLWTEIDINLLCCKFVNALIPTVIKNEVDLQQLTTLYEYWLDINLQSAPEDEHHLRVKLMVENASNSFESVLSTDYLYSLASLLLSKFGRNSSTRELYVELFVRTMVIDINCIEKYRAETPLAPHKVQLRCEALASRMLELAAFFEDCNETSRDLQLTSFSLKPTKELFDILFPTIASNLVDTSNSPHTPEDLQLPVDLCNDLLTVIFKPRWAALGRQVKGDELRLICKKLLEEDFSWLATGRQNTDLKYVNVDYDAYSHLPSKYDPNDDGIEKGFTVSGKRKSKRHPGCRRLQGVRDKKDKILKPIKRTLTGKNRGQGRRNWIKNSSGINKASKISKNVSNMHGKANRKPKVVSTSPKLKPGRKSKFPEINEKLNTVTQYLRQTETLKRFLEATEASHPTRSVSHTRAKKLKEQYKAAYCKEVKNLPGHVDLVSIPTAYNYRAKGVYIDSNRTKPTGYLGPTTPLQLRFQGVGNFDVEFRLEKEFLTRKLIDANRPRVKQQHYVRPQNAQNLLPTSKYNRWAMCAEDFSVSLTSSDEKSTSTAQILSKQGVTSTVLHTIEQLESSPLKHLTKEYNNFKENMSHKECTEGFDVERPTALEFIVPIPVSSNSPTAEISAGEPNKNKEFAGTVVGDVVEFKALKKIIRFPPCPKNMLEALRLEIMLKDATERIRKNLNHKTYQYPVVQQQLKEINELIKNSDEDTVTRDPAKTSAELSTAQGDFTPRPIDDTELANITQSLQDCQYRTSSGPNGVKSLRGRKRKLTRDEASASLIQITSGALKEKLQKFEKVRGNQNSSTMSIRKGRRQRIPSVSSSSTCNLGSTDASSLLKDLVVRNPAYVVSKGVSPLEQILRTVSNEEFSEALQNMGEKKSPQKTSTCFGDDYALKVWRLYNQNKNIGQIQSELACSWGPVNRRINDANYIERVVQVLRDNSCSFRRRYNIQKASKSDDVCPTDTHGQSTTMTSQDDNSLGHERLDTTGMSNTTATDNCRTSEIIQSKKDAERPKFQILFPLLQNASVRKAGELVAKKPLDIPKAPSTTQIILHDQSGLFTEVPDEGDDEEECEKIKSALSVPWPDEIEDQIGWDKEDEEHIQSLEDKCWELLDEIPAHPEVVDIDSPQIVASDTDEGGNTVTTKEAVATDGVSNGSTIKTKSVASRKRKLPESPETYSEVSSSSTSSFLSNDSSSSSESIAKRPRNRRVLRKRNDETNLCPGLVSTSIETDKEKRIRLTRLCQQKQVTILLNHIPQNELLKYGKMSSSSTSSLSVNCTDASEGNCDVEPEVDQVTGDDIEDAVITDIEPVDENTGSEKYIEAFPGSSVSVLPPSHTLDPIALQDSTEDISGNTIEDDREKVVEQGNSEFDDSGVVEVDSKQPDLPSLGRTRSPVTWSNASSNSVVFNNVGSSEHVHIDQQDLPSNMIDPHHQPSALKVDIPFNSPSANIVSEVQLQVEEVTPVKRSSRIKNKDTQLSFKNGVVLKIPTRNVGEEKQSTLTTSALKSNGVHGQLRSKRMPCRNKSKSRESRALSKGKELSGMLQPVKLEMASRKRSSRCNRAATKPDVQAKKRKTRVSSAINFKPDDMDDDSLAEESPSEDNDDDYHPESDHNDYPLSEDDMESDVDVAEAGQNLRIRSLEQENAPEINAFLVNTGDENMSDACKEYQPCPIINPIQVNISSKRKSKHQPIISKSTVIQKDPLRASYSPDTVIEEIDLGSESDSEVVEVPYTKDIVEHLKGTEQLQHIASNEDLPHMHIDQDKNDANNSIFSGRFQYQDTTFIQTSGYPDAQNSDIQLENPALVNNSPEMILGLDEDEDNSISFNENEGSFHYVNTCTNNSGIPEIVMSDESYQDDCEQPTTPLNEEQTAGVPDVVGFLEPTPPTLVPMYEDCSSEQVENLRDAPTNESVSPPTLLKYDCGDDRN